MVALFLRGKCYALYRQVIALGTIACKGNLGRPAPKDVSYLFAGTINGLHSMTTQCVDTARIAILSSEVRQHSLQYTRIERCSSGMIKVDNTFCHGILFLCAPLLRQTCRPTINCVNWRFRTIVHDRYQHMGSEDNLIKVAGHRLTINIDFPAR